MNRFALVTAMDMAMEAHKDQHDKAGQPYFLHLSKVANLTVYYYGHLESLQVVAWLHDILEDTSITRNDLIREGIPENYVEAIEAMTHREGESYRDFIKRVKANPLARKVKICDIIHNTDLSRLIEITKKDIERNKMYLGALERLLEEDDRGSETV